MIKKIQDVLNSQLNAELYSSYLYLSMAAYFTSVNLKGFSNWMRIQAQEELAHAIKFYDYILKEGGKIVLPSIERPPADWRSAEQVFDHTYEHEKKVTGLINNLVEIAGSENDKTTLAFLQWFVDEQVEEEGSAEKALKRIRAADNSGKGLSEIDKDLGKRVFTAHI